MNTTLQINEDGSGKLGDEDFSSIADSVLETVETPCDFSLVDDEADGFFVDTSDELYYDYECFLHGQALDKQRS